MLVQATGAGSYHCVLRASSENRLNVDGDIPWRCAARSRTLNALATRWALFHPRRLAPHRVFSSEVSMRRVSTIRRLHGLVLAMGCALAGAVQAQGLVDGGSMVVLGRYSIASAEPPEELSRPLDVVATVSYPRQTVRTVGDALRHTLERTGYRLAEPAADGDVVLQFLALPLPESQRQLGPYRVRSLLDVLLGTAWSWHSDASTREVRVTPSGGAAAEPLHAVRCTPWATEHHAPAIATPVPPNELPRMGSPG